MKNSDYINSFDYIRTDRDATTIANTIVASRNDPKKKDIWYNSQLQLLKAIILYCKYEMPFDKRNIGGVLEFIREHDPNQDEEDGISDLDEVFLELDCKHPARIAYECGFMKSQKETRASIMLSLITTIGDYSESEVMEFMSKSDFLYEEVATKKTIIYVIIPLMDSSWEGIINLFFNQFFNELYLVGAKNNTRLPRTIIFYLDEFTNLGKFEDYENFLSTCRGYGISCCTIVQHITQLQERYGDKKADSIIGDCAIKLCLGNVNETTQKYFSSLMGTATIKVETGSSSVTKGKSGSSSTSDSYTYIKRKLMEPDEISVLRSDECICIISGKYPIILKKAKQFEVFPGITKENRVNQYDYKRNTSELAKSYVEEQMYLDTKKG